MYDSLDMERDIIFSHFGAFFVLLTPLTTQKIKILKKKNAWIYHHFTEV